MASTEWPQWSKVLASATMERPKVACAGGTPDSEAFVLATKQRAVGALELASIEWLDGALQAARIDGLLAEWASFKLSGLAESSMAS